MTARWGASLTNFLEIDLSRANPSQRGVSWLRVCLGRQNRDFESMRSNLYPNLAFVLLCKFHFVPFCRCIFCLFGHLDWYEIRMSWLRLMMIQRICLSANIIFINRSTSKRPLRPDAGTRFSLSIRSATQMHRPSARSPCTSTQWSWLYF